MIDRSNGERKIVMTVVAKRAEAVALGAAIAGGRRAAGVLLRRRHVSLREGAPGDISMGRRGRTFLTVGDRGCRGRSPVGTSLSR